MKFQMTLAAFLAAVSVQVLAQDVVKIGHVAPLSGAIAHLGKDNEYGARMAIEELNAKGVSIGGKKVKFELLAEDDAADPKQGTAAAQKLVDQNVHGVVGPFPLPKFTAMLAFRKFHLLPPTQNSPAKATKPPSAWWLTMCIWAVPWAAMQPKT